jgi:choline dehydrogenase-like flavoprotein
MFWGKKRGPAMLAAGSERADASYDIVIIGSGVGGATLAQKLAPTGKSILILERGDRLPVEPHNWDAYEVFVNHRYRTDEKWRDRKNRRFHPTTHYWVGGNSSFYGAALFRFRKGDFDEVRHEGGISPAWPISYTDLRPYYDEAERIWQVHGTRGADPTDDPDAPEYPFPAIEHDADIAILKGQLEKAGWRPFDLPLGIDRHNSEPWRGRCVRCATCGGFPCLTRGKSDARRIVDEVETYANVVVKPNTKVIRLETDGRGASIKSVVCETPHGRQRIKGDIVIVAAGAANSAALLLRSRNAAHPAGLANGSDQVGRNYMFHTLSAVLSATASKTTATFPKTFALNDFYWNDPEGGFDFPMGHVQLLEYMNADTIRGQVSSMIPPSLFPRLIAGAIAKRITAFLVISEDLPLAKNRVRVNRKDEIVLDYWYNNLAGHERLNGKFIRKLHSLGRICGCFRQSRFQFSELLPLFGTAHQCGTLRMGADPASSVVDPHCKAHEIDNLYVVDSSVFVSSAAVNPALTIAANGLRVGDHLIDRLK